MSYLMLVLNLGDEDYPGDRDTEVSGEKQIETDVEKAVE